MSKSKDRLSVTDASTLEAEFGWPRRMVELAMANAIRLAYLDRNMVAEADVNITEGTLAVRRRNGGGSKGEWVDIDDPLLPTRHELIMSMDMMQYGDGAPGRVVEGVVKQHRADGVVYGLRDNRTVVVPANLMSVQDTFHKPEIGTKQVLALITGTDDATGHKLATRRGREFVASVLEEFHPECVTGVWTGASNSWAVIRMKPQHINTWLENKGMNIKAMQALLGLKRITLMPEGQGSTPDEKFENELKHFVNNAWKNCLIRRITPTEVTVYTPMDDQDPKKLRTFTSMLKKIVPDRNIVVK
ncbi:MAG: hypothetical protein WAZ18_00375 [Alphaproteobacteria bacterium]